MSKLKNDIFNLLLLNKLSGYFKGLEALSDPPFIKWRVRFTTEISTQISQISTQISQISTRLKSTQQFISNYKSKFFSLK